MYQYYHQTSAEEIAADEERVSLHDCRATGVSLQGRTLSFRFSDGFYVARDGSDGKKLFYTDESRVEFPLLYPDDESITIYVFTEENGKTVREECEIDDFINKIDEKGYELEFIYSYIGFHTFKFECWLWFDEEPYHKECELTISAKKEIYQWNNMYEEES